MPARSALVPKCCLHKPGGRAYVRIRGKVVYVGKNGTADSRQAYGRLIAEFAADPAPDATAAASSQITVVELIDAYWHHTQGYDQNDGRPTRNLDSIRLALRPVQQLYGTTRAASFGPLALRQPSAMSNLSAVLHWIEYGRQQGRSDARLSVGKDAVGYAATSIFKLTEYSIVSSRRGGGDGH